MKDYVLMIMLTIVFCTQVFVWIEIHGLQMTNTLVLAGYPIQSQEETRIAIRKASK